MVNGIIDNKGGVKLIKNNANSKLIGIKSNLKFNKKDVGSSVCCNGVCLTLNKVEKKLIYFYVSSETIKRSNFKNIKKGQIINFVFD